MSKVTDFILESIDDADGDLWYYTKIVKENKEAYRTLEEYISSRMDKQELADRLGLTTPRAIESWETKGMKFQRAMECAIALKLNLEEANEFLAKYGGMRALYPASKQEFRLIYVLIYREELEKQFPYKENESVKEWIQRIFPLLEFVNKANAKSEETDNSSETDIRVSTETYLDVLMEQNLELIPKLQFRSAGAKALEYLDELVKDTPFEKNHGNRSNENADDEKEDEVDENKDLNERNGSIRKELFEEEEKDHYQLLRKKLEKGDIPHRDAVIQFALGMTLNLEKEKVDQLLIKSGYEPLQARNLYEGLLITLYRYEENADADYIDFQVFVSEKVDEAMEELPEVANLLRELPQWYMNKQDRKKRLEKKCFSDMISLMSSQMTRIWKLVNRNHLEKVSESTLRKVASNQILELRDHYLDKDTYHKVLGIIQRTEAAWVEIVNSGLLLGMNRTEYIKIFDETLCELEDYYCDVYAPKKKRSENKGQKGGRSQR